MSEQYVVLHNDGAILDERRGGAPGAFAAGEITVQTHDLDPDEASDVAIAPTTMSIAPSMPMKLHEPIIDDSGPDALEGVTWGVRAVRADASPFDGKGVTVAVLDTGIDLEHDAFRLLRDRIVTQDFTGEGDGDVNGHGTHCAGTIAGADIDGLRIGVARNVGQLLVGKVLGADGGGSTVGIANAMQWAIRNNAHVISMSLGMDFPGRVKLLIDDGVPADLATSRALADYRSNLQLFDAISKLANASGALDGQATIIVAASGNESRRHQRPDHAIGVAPPAAATDVISVGALGETDNGLQIAPFSNTGSTLCGPGVGILSARTGGGIKSLSGTSMATPHVAGVAALWAQKLLERSGVLPRVEFSSRLVASSTMSGVAEQFTAGDLGSGLVQAPQRE